MASSLSLLLFGAVDFYEPFEVAPSEKASPSAVEGEPEGDALVFYNGPEGLLCKPCRHRWTGAQDLKDGQPGEGGKDAVYKDVPLAALRAALMLEPEAQEAFVDAVVSGDVRTAVAMLGARSARRVPSEGMSLYRILLQRDVADVQAGSAIVKIHGVVNPILAVGVAAELNNPFLGSVMMCALHVAVSMSREAPLAA